MHRREFLSVVGAATAAWPLGASAQQTMKGPRIGFLVTASASAYASRIEAVRTGLRELGYVEGRNISFDYRYADSKYDRLIALVRELIDGGADVLVTHGTPGTQSAKQATATIPIVMAIVAMPSQQALLLAWRGRMRMSRGRPFSIPSSR
jgi:putative ABC transport system substrate-binding protein